MEIKVAIIDDDAVIRFLHKTLVQKSKLDANPLLFENGSSAWEFLKNYNPEEEQALLLLLDLQMPEMDGWQVLEKLETLDFEFPVYVIMLLSSVSRSDEVRAASYKSVIGYIQKPLDLYILEKVKTLDKLQPYY